MEHTAVVDPHAEYQRRLESRQGTLARLQRREAAISNTRLAIFLAGVVLLVLAFVTSWLNPLWLLVPLGLFLVVIVIHDGVIRRRDGASLAVQYYEQALARLQGRWAGTGIQRDGFFDEHHPYAPDLDLFGHGSLFELLCTARTGAGEEKLASWLLAPAPVEVIRRRQEAVAEMRLLVDLREDLALLGGGMRAELDPDALSRWGEARAPLSSAQSTILRWVGLILTVAAVVAAVLWARGMGPLPLLGVALVEWLVHRLAGSRINPMIQAVERAEREIRILGGVLARIERERLTAPLLAELHGLLDDQGRTASASIRHLDHLVGWLESRRNPLFAPIGFLLMWQVHFSLLIEDWRRRVGGKIRRWLDSVGELEALGSLAAYAFEHPTDPYPELTVEGPQFRAKQLGHPLIAVDACVLNDVDLCGADVPGAEAGARGAGEPPRSAERSAQYVTARTWIVSGSNMSGKTTLLRTIGVNTVLALCGAPVRAASLTLSPLAIGATIRIHDSLQAKRSRFYAEIQRLKQLMDMAQGPLPLLFLLDEILHGTNSRDRQIGATALVRQFLDRGAIGLVTTHDLAIADASAKLDRQVHNVHFRDHLHQGQLAFDYKVHPGVVQGSNAIALMRAVGLEIDPALDQDDAGLKKITSSISGST